VATSKKISVMLSSRCRDNISFGGKTSTLTDVRTELKNQLEKSKFLDHLILDVWINELTPAQEGSTDSWDACLEQIDDADIVIVLYNGNAGWSVSPTGIGICHAELERALAQAPAKVRLIALDPLTASPTDKDQRFRDYIDAQSLFRSSASTGEDLIKVTKEVLAAAIVNQVGLGLREAKKGKYHLGAALDWTRLDFENRKASMEKVITETLGGKANIIKLDKKNILFSVHAIPDAFSTSEAREMAGRPFLLDYKLVNDVPLSKAANHGPVHIIGVHKSMTESQARTFVGHPNIILVNAPFGFYLADRIDHSQTLIVTECRDETSTRHGVQRCMDWLMQSGEAEKIAVRAEKRKQILIEIAKHQ
jgi:hypothetical protein